MAADLTSLEAIWVVLGEACTVPGEASSDDEPWFVCFTTNERDAVRAVEVCTRDVASLTSTERETMFDYLAKTVRPELVQIIESRRAKLTLDRRYAGAASGAMYRYEMVERWPDFGQRFDEAQAARLVTPSVHAEPPDVAEIDQSAALSHSFDVQGPGLAELRAAFDALGYFDPRIPGAPPVLEMLGNATLAVFGERPPEIVEGPGIPEMREVLARLPDSIAIAFDPKVYRWIAAARVVVGGKP